MRRATFAALSLAGLLVVTAGFAGEPDRTPELATGRSERQQVQARTFMVATANAHATQAAYRIIKQGGNAVDAAIAATMVLTLVEPQSSGLGGGCFILYWDRAHNQLHSYDGRETAPAAVDEKLFLEQGQPLAFQDAVAGGRAVGVPGQVKSLALLHQQHGRLPWKALFDEAIRLAENGFKVSPRLADLLRNQVFRAKLQRNATARRYFYPRGKPLAAGTLLKNPELARTLRLLARSGSDGFYRGDLAQNLVTAVRRDPHPGRLQLTDLEQYQAKERPPVCAAYRQFRVCGMGPPSSGGIGVLEILGILQQTDIADHTPLSPPAIHLFAQAGRLAFADRNRYLADSDFIKVPVAGLLKPEYLQRRAMLIDATTDRGKASAGTPAGIDASSYLPGKDTEQHGTSHLSIVDADGNGIALTASIEQGFGSGIMVDGFLLNNQLTDFSFRNQDQNGQLIANRVEAGKRPRSSMAPTMVFGRSGKLKLLIGSPGGSRIIPFVAQTLIGVLDWKLSIQEAINLPHYLHRNGDFLELEAGTELETQLAPLTGFGYRTKLSDLNSGLQGILMDGQELHGGSDPRREGLVQGD